MDHDMVEWHNATLERIAAALERIADHLEATAAEAKQQLKDREILEERIAEAEARREGRFGG